ncbi:MAG: hypothetical protein A2289_20390 [Deltaproteobacteria bacterium RIFOXYA12_FULL_58_15]|nr:MAG: hypothetical protein A2289_20390 [Deltaproteobacteria bacterium RIFOXYA12_FULL_58_15]OGR14371.1 MAG: hypothetical protein A2341_25590 [Deltaproteobacteria bacterium RIFOXYB12_FULL_58_9]
MFLVVATTMFVGCQRPESSPASPEGKVIRVLTDRTSSHLDNIFAYYEKETGVKVETHYTGDGLLARLTERPQEADLIVTKNADLLEIAKTKGLLAPIASQTVFDNVPRAFRDPDDRYVILSFRARAIFIAKARVAIDEVKNYNDLLAPRWKGRVCVRSGFHEYNVSWFSQMAVVEGIEATEKFIFGLRENLARSPRGNDRAQVRALLEDDCDLAVANSYYMGLMRRSEDQKRWAAASEVVFPEQEGRGAYAMRSGAALTHSKSQPWRASHLLEFLTGEMAQHYFSEALDEYPVKRGVPPSAMNASLGKAQGIEDGAFKVNLVSLAEATKQRDAVLDVLTRAQFDGK